MNAEAAVSNVVLVTVDSLRADAIGTDGDDEVTPEIGRLAEAGVVFENAFAHGNWTPFSFPSVFASRPVFAESDDIGLPETPVLAEVLRDAGVRTGGFNAANGFLTAHWGYDRGFDVFEPFVGGDDPGRYHRYLAAHPTVHAWLQLATSPFRRLAHRLKSGSDSLPFTDTSRLLDVERAAVEFVQSVDEPFCLWVHYMDAHTPYVPAPRHLREVTDDQLATHRLVRAHAKTGLGMGVGDRTLEDLRTLYAGAVRQVDASVGRLREALSAAGVADETALVVTGDHGEAFMEHGHLAHYPKLYDNLVHVPLLIRVPGRQPQTVSDAVGLDSVAPTVADLLGVEWPAAWEGESLLPVVEGREPVDDGPVVSVAVRGETVTQQPIPRRLDDGDLLASARTERWTYVENTATGEAELYDRETDPDHQHDLCATGDAPTDVCDRLAAAVDRYVATLGGSEADSEQMDDAIATRLDALGYR